MASIATAIIGNGGGQLLDGLAHVISAVKGKSPEDAAALEQLTAKYQSDILAANTELEKAHIDENIQLNSIAGQNVRADAQSGDKYVSRARPSIIYVGLFILAFNYIALAFLSRWGFKIADLPSMFWETWGVVSTGVVMTRTVDKLFGGQGGSVALPFGIRMDSKGD